MTPLRVALTGGIASGKSYCLGRLAALGVPVIDADQIARDVVRPGSAALAAITARFGPGILEASGALDRGALAAVVFADPSARQDLEAIVHPDVYAAIEAWFARLSAPVAIADIPLLFETEQEGQFDAVIVAACPPDQQLERLRARGHSETEARQRLASQLSVDSKSRRADYVINTSGTFEETDRQVLEVWERLRNTAMRQ